MKKARLTEEQMIGILQEHEAGAKCADLCRKHGMSEGTFYAWKAKYSGMTVSEGRQCCAIGPSDNGDAAEGAGSSHCPPLVRGQWRGRTRS
jgi:transposase-like protein